MLLICANAVTPQNGGFHMRHLVLAALLATAPAHAEWRAADASVEAAAREPDIAAVLAQTVRIDAALMAQDRALFVAMFSPDAMVNGPANRVNDAGGAVQNYDRGFINYSYYRRTIEYAGKRPGGEVVLMGEEAVSPRAPNPLAGKALRRRFTDVWRKDGGAWKLALRQATIFEVK